MAKVKIQGHASGTGIFTVTAPDSDTNRTITLPDGTGTLAFTTGDDDKLPLAGGTMTGHILHNTNIMAKYGSANQMQIYSDGTESFINEDGSGSLNLQGTNVKIKTAGGTATQAHFNAGAESALYYNNSKKFETTDAGIKITGSLLHSNVIEASSGINASTKTITINPHITTPGNHWDRLTILVWLVGISGGMSDGVNKHWRHTCTGMTTWDLGSATEIWGGTPPTTTAGTMTTSQLQFTVDQPAGNAAIKVQVLGHSMQAGAKIVFS